MCIIFSLMIIYQLTDSWGASLDKSISCVVITYFMRITEKKRRLTIPENRD